MEAEKKPESNLQEVSFLDAIIPVIVLAILLFSSVKIYGDDSSSGPNQVALILAAAVALLIGWKKGHAWVDIEKSIASGISRAFGAILIMLMIGALIGTWILSGTVPTMIYYGLKLINPEYFYLTACILCAGTAVCIGSSWSVIGTIGIGLIGIAAGLGLSLEITAGAIISGAYFGDKVSPLSDTTNLAAATTGVELFTHIQNMFWTTVPAIVIALIAFTFLGLSGDAQDMGQGLEEKLALLEGTFDLGLYLLIPLAVTLFLAMKRYPAFPTLLFASFLGCVFAVIFQQDVILKFIGSNNLSDWRNIIDGIWRALFEGYTANTGNTEMDKLLTRGGMGSMLDTIWLIICAITFGSILEHLGMLKKIVKGMIEMARTTGSLIFVTAFTCIGVNILAADQYIAIILPGRMFSVEYEKRGLEAKNLSRVLEDAGTVTSVLIPWNTCGAFVANTLGISTFDYLMFCFFNLLCPVISVIYGYMNFKITRITSKDDMKGLAYGE